MAVLTSAILNAGKENLAYLAINNASSYQYACMGVGDSTAAAVSNDSGIMGNESHYLTVTPTYEADYKASWVGNFSYGNLPTHIFSEATIAESTTSYLDKSIARIVYDAITLNLSDTLQITIKLNFS